MGNPDQDALAPSPAASNSNSNVGLLVLGNPWLCKM
jgi:hypothetical protein